VCECLRKCKDTSRNFSRNTQLFFLKRLKHKPASYHSKTPSLYSLQKALTADIFLRTISSSISSLCYAFVGVLYKISCLPVGTRVSAPKILKTPLNLKRISEFTKKIPQSISTRLGHSQIYN
jgi:hypothetical protein